LRVALGVVLVSAAHGCSEPCCVLDSLPIGLLPSSTMSSTGGIGGIGTGLKARGRDSEGDLDISVDTGSALTLYARRANEGSQMVPRSFDLLDGMNPMASPVRARLDRIEGLPIPLDGQQVVLGGTFLTNFSVQLNFSAPSMTLWPRLGASDGYLTRSGFAVLHFDVLGGAELSAVSRPDFIGLTGPVELPPTRVVLRGCAFATPFDPGAISPQLCCQRGDDLANATGVNLALLVATGVGPLVLSRSAWTRATALQDTQPPEPAIGPDLLIPGFNAPISGALWSTLTGLALVDPETDAASNPGACVELGRSRRLHWVAAHRAQSACAQPCDTDVRNAALAQNAAAYLEIGRTVSVAIIPDETPWLQALRAEIRPEGPELDGLLGADVFAETTLELDYRSHPGRAVLACGPANSTSCFTSPRCQRLENDSDEHACFGLPPSNLPSVCAASGCGP
jgi:hypothetical protein